MIKFMTSKMLVVPVNPPVQTAYSVLVCLSVSLSVCLSVRTSPRAFVHHFIHLCRIHRLTWKRGVQLFRYFLSLMRTPHLSRHLDWADVFMIHLAVFSTCFVTTCTVRSRDRKYLNSCTPPFDVSLCICAIWCIVHRLVSFQIRLLVHSLIRSLN